MSELMDDAIINMPFDIAMNTDFGRRQYYNKARAVWRDREARRALGTVDFIWAFEWCSCVYESDFAIQSLHKTVKGAYEAKKKFLEQAYIEHMTPSHWSCMFPFFENERVRIRKIKIED